MRRYPLQNLADAMQLSPRQACAALGIEGSTTHYRRNGLTEETAERLAAKAGFHAFDVWPEMIDCRIEDCSRPCDNCGERFVPARRDGRFCQRDCYRRYWQNHANERRRSQPRDERRYWQDPEWREQRLSYGRAYKASMSPAALRRERERLRLSKAAARERKAS